MSTSIFKPRIDYSDSKDVFDSEETIRRMFKKDWEYCIGKSKFKRFLSGKGRGVICIKYTLYVYHSALAANIAYLVNAGSASISDVETAMCQHYASFVRIFDHQASSSSGKDIFALHLNEWGQLMMECGIPDEASTTCRLSHLDTIFVATNFEEEKQSKLSDANLDGALMRFEFAEALVRVARLKFIDSQRDPDLKASSDAEAIHKLHELLHLFLGPEAKVK